MKMALPTKSTLGFVHGIIQRPIEDTMKHELIGRLQQSCDLLDHECCKRSYKKINFVYQFSILLLHIKSGNLRRVDSA